MERGRHLRALLLGGAVTLNSCAGGQASAPAPVSSASASTVAESGCHAEVREVDVSSWRTVATDRFSFCLPPGWSGNGRSWRKGSATLAWGTGERPPSERSAFTGKMEVSPTFRRFTEQIGGRMAELWRFQFGPEHRSGAEWSAEHTWMVGTAEDASTADLQLAIFRTVRLHAR